MPNELKDALTEFARFAQALGGDEKSEAQTFLDHFFRALGHAGAIEAGATFEFRVAKKPGSAQLELIQGNGAGPRGKGGKKFADLLWPDRVLIEMKSRGENLEKHYDQIFDYWTHIVPKRPPLVILCNFDEFWIYDFNIQLFDPVERVKLAELSENIAPFNFLLPVWKKPIFGNNWVEVTRRAADQMATVFREIVDRGEDRERAQRFILQLRCDGGGRHGFAPGEHLDRSAARVRGKRCQLIRPDRRLVPPDGDDASKFRDSCFYFGDALRRYRSNNGKAPTFPANDARNHATRHISAELTS